MTTLQQHEMQLAKTHPSGAEEWYCPICGRRFLMHMQAELNIMVLEAGNRSVNHVGSKGGLKMGSCAIDYQPLLSEDLRNALDEALQDIDFDDWPDVVDQ